MFDALVTAETAPLGVQIWPTTTPDAAPNFTLAEVITFDANDEVYVRWTYKNGNTRVFRLGERVAVRVESREQLAGCDAVFPGETPTGSTLDEQIAALQALRAAYGNLPVRIVKDSDDSSHPVAGVRVLDGAVVLDIDD
jgi:hypothetical protein